MPKKKDDSKTNKPKSSLSEILGEDITTTENTKPKKKSSSKKVGEVTKPVEVNTTIPEEQQVIRKEKVVVENADELRGLDGKSIDMDKFNEGGEETNILLQGLNQKRQEIAATQASIDQKLKEQGLEGGIEDLAKIGEGLQEPPKLNDGDINSSNGDDSVDSLLDDIDDEIDRKTTGLSENPTVEEVLESLEASKVYSVPRTPFDKYNGPAEYFVADKQEYTDTVLDTMGLDSIRTVTKGEKERATIIETYNKKRFEVAVPLVNSGIWVRFKGASIDDIIAMNTLEEDTPIATLTEKLASVFNHMTASSVGKLTIKAGVRCISYYDLDSLFYGLFASTNPDNAEIARECAHCGNVFYDKLNTRHLLLNHEEFTDAADYIKSVSTLDELKACTDLSKNIVKQFGNVVIYLRHPSIFDFLTVIRSIDLKLTKRYPDIAELTYAIDKIEIITDSGKVKYVHPNEIITTIAKLDPEEIFEIIDLAEQTKPNEAPVYGLDEVKCPHCSADNPSTPISMSNLLFLYARQRKELETIKWRAKKKAMEDLKKAEREKKNQAK